MLRWVVVVMLASGCLEAQAVHCADGTVCPDGKICEPIHATCVTEDQLTSCGNGTCDGLCDQGVCLVGRCGDGVVSGTEECDGTAFRADLSCTSLGYYVDLPLACGADCFLDLAACAPAGICGDRKIDVGFEDCDGPDLGGTTCTDLDFYDPGPVTCTNRCHFNDVACTGTCGDHVANGGELCDGSWTSPEQCVDFGYQAGAMACTASSCGPSYVGCASFGWTASTTPLATHYTATWTTAANDIWAVGSAGVVHFDGTSWKAVPGPTTTELLLSVWGSGPSDVWIGATNGTVFHGPTTWTTMQIPNADGIAGFWGAAADDLWATSSGATALAHWDGATWSAVARPVGSTASASAIWGFAANDIWVGAGDLNGAELWHFTGSWSRAPFTAAAPPIQTIWGAAPNDVWAGVLAHLFHYNGIAWSEITAPSAISVLSIRGTSSSDVWTAGNRPSHWDGISWTTIDDGRGASRLAGLGSVLWSIGADGRIFHHDGRTLAEVPAITINAIWGSRPDDVWAVGEGLRHYTGAWTIDPSVLPVATAVFGFAANDVWLGTEDGTIFHRTASTWVQETLAPIGAIAWLWGTSPTDLWAATNGLKILHRTAGGWAVDHTFSAGVFAIAGTSASDIWVVGSSGMVAHYNGTAWTETTIGSTQLRSVTATAPDDAWAAGDAGFLAHWNGTQWQPIASGTFDGITNVVATGRDDAIYTTRTIAAHWNGTGWTKLELGLSNLLRLAWAFPRHVFAIANDGMAHLDRVTPWDCHATEQNCGDQADDDCDGLADTQDADCTTNVRLHEVSSGTTNFIEIENRATTDTNLAGITVAWRASCDAAANSYTFAPTPVLAAGNVARVTDAATVGKREAWAGRAICAAPTNAAWYALCAGPCDLTNCANVIDTLAVGASPPGMPACLQFSPGVVVSGATATDAVVRSAYTSFGRTGTAAEWTVAPATRD